MNWIKLLFFVVAISFFNRSIDLDHLRKFCLINNASDFDDVDNIAEYLLEEMAEDSNLLSEEDQDSGDQDQSSGNSQQSVQPLICENFSPLQIEIFSGIGAKIICSYRSHTSPGFSSIVAPPPDFKG